MKREGNDIVFQVVNYIIFGIFALICVYPFYYIVINTISANDLVDKGKIVFFPRGIHFSNYVDMLQRNGIARSAVVQFCARSWEQVYLCLAHPTWPSVLRNRRCGPKSSGIGSSLSPCISARA